eukprot:746962-Pyramimonas_sp.AAC.1
MTQRIRIRGHSSSTRPSSDLWMQQMNAPDDFGWVYVDISSGCARQLELSTGNRHDSNNTNSFADLARVADRVQTSGCNRQTHLIIPRGFLLISAL